MNLNCKPLLNNVVCHKLNQKVNEFDQEIDMILSNKQKSKALIRLHGSAGWSAPLMFANTEDRFSRVVAQIMMTYHRKVKMELK